MFGKQESEKKSRKILLDYKVPLLPLNLSKHLKTKEETQTGPIDKSNQFHELKLQYLKSLAKSPIRGSTFFCRWISHASRSCDFGAHSNDKRLAYKFECRLFPSFSGTCRFFFFHVVNTLKLGFAIDPLTYLLL